MAQRDIVAIGGSTGSTGMLRRIPADLPHGLPAMVLIATHVPSGSGDPFAGALRFRRRTGHASATEPVNSARESGFEEALGSALRMTRERTGLVSRVAHNARETGRDAVAELAGGARRRIRPRRGHPAPCGHAASPRGRHGQPRAIMPGRGSGRAASG